MKLHRFYLANNLDEVLEVRDERLLHQWRNVLRFENDATLRLFNDGEEATYRLDNLSRKHATLIKQSTEPRMPELPERWLLFAPLRREHTELVIQKATELGVSHIIPIISMRSTTKDSNTERLQKIAIEASEQSGRQSVPVIHDCMAIDQAIMLARQESIELYLADERLDGETQSTTTNKGIIIGPEGGWDPAELSDLSACCRPINLGQLTLRAETAAIVGLFAISR